MNTREQIRRVNELFKKRMRVIREIRIKKQELKDIEGQIHWLQCEAPIEEEDVKIIDDDDNCGLLMNKK